MLCAICDNISLRALHSQYGYAHMSSFEDLRASAESHTCSLCTLLWCAVKPKFEDNSDLDDSKMRKPVRLALNGHLKSFVKKSIEKMLRRDEKGGSSFYAARSLMASSAPSTITICALVPDTFHEGKFRLSSIGRVSLYPEGMRQAKPNFETEYGGRPVFAQADSDESFQLAAYWIRRCLTEHKGCRRVKCPIEWTDEIDTHWTNNSSSDSDISDNFKTVEDTGNSSVPMTTNLEYMNASDVDEPPRKRIRTALVEDAKGPTTSDFWSKFCRSLQKERNSPLVKGYLSRPVFSLKRSMDRPYGLEDGSWKFYLGSNEIEELESDQSELLQELTIPYLPTRYIDVTSNPPRLQEALPGSRGYYIALSHCWGKSKPLVTTSQTLPERMHGITMSSFPKTFRDAVFITRELGIESLWIDSLCILQDSVEDWQKESSKMGFIYSNAFLTITAGGSTDSSQGIFRARSKQPFPPVEIQPRDSDLTSLYVANFIEDIPFESPQSTDDRAWCLQETALSPRVLIYGREMMGWLCDSCTDTEHGTSFDHTEDPSPPLLAPRLQLTNPHKLLGKEYDLYHYLDEKEKAVGRWASIVNQFTRRRITRESDRLPALSGIAKQIQLETKDEYLAGLWKKDLRYDMLWEVSILFSKETDEWKRPARYRAPSWSWASIEGPIEMSLKSNIHVKGPETRELPQIFEVLEAQVDNDSLDPLGEVSGGYLRLRTVLRQVTLRIRVDKEGELLDLNNPPWEQKRLRERYLEVFSQEDRCLGKCCLDLPEEINGTKASLWWLSVDKYHGLLVMKLEKSEEYRRAGLAWVHRDEGIEIPEFDGVERKEIILV